MAVAATAAVVAAVSMAEVEASTVVAADSLAAEADFMVVAAGFMAVASVAGRLAAPGLLAEEVSPGAAALVVDEGRASQEGVRSAAAVISGRSEITGRMFAPDSTMATGILSAETQDSTATALEISTGEASGGVAVAGAGAAVAGAGADGASDGGVPAGALPGVPGGTAPIGMPRIIRHTLIPLIPRMPTTALMTIRHRTILIRPMTTHRETTKTHPTRSMTTTPIPILQTT